MSDRTVMINLNSSNNFDFLDKQTGVNVTVQVAESSYVGEFDEIFAGLVAAPPDVALVQKISGDAFKETKVRTEVSAADEELSGGLSEAKTPPAANFVVGDGMPKLVSASPQEPASMSFEKVFLPVTGEISGVVEQTFSREKPIPADSTEKIQTLIQSANLSPTAAIKPIAETGNILDHYLQDNNEQVLTPFVQAQTSAEVFEKNLSPQTATRSVLSFENPPILTRNDFQATPKLKATDKSLLTVESVWQDAAAPNEPRYSISPTIDQTVSREDFPAEIKSFTEELASKKISVEFSGSNISSDRTNSAVKANRQIAESLPFETVVPADLSAQTTVCDAATPTVSPFEKQPLVNLSETAPRPATKPANEIIVAPTADLQIEQSILPESNSPPKPLLENLFSIAGNTPSKDSFENRVLPDFAEFDLLTMKLSSRANGIFAAADASTNGKTSPISPLLITPANSAEITKPAPANYFFDDKTSSEKSFVPPSAIETVLTFGNSNRLKAQDFVPSQIVRSIEDSTEKLVQEPAASKPLTQVEIEAERTAANWKGFLKDFSQTTIKFETESGLTGESAALINKETKASEATAKPTVTFENQTTISINEPAPRASVKPTMQPTNILESLNENLVGNETIRESAIPAEKSVENIVPQHLPVLKNVITGDLFKNLFNIDRKSEASEPNFLEAQPTTRRESPETAENNANSAAQSKNVASGIGNERLKTNKIQFAKPADVAPTTIGKTEKTIEMTEESPIIFYEELSMSVRKESKVKSLVPTGAVNQADVFEQIEKPLLQAAILNAKTAEPEILKLRLRPAELGTVEIRLEKTDAGTIKVHFQTESEAARHVLADSFEQLKTSLEKSGWRVEQIEVTANQLSANNGGERQPRGDEHQTRRTNAENLMNKPTSLGDNAVESGDLKAKPSNRLLSVRA